MIPPDDPADLLSLFADALDGAPGLLLERSVRLGAAGAEAGRFTAWLRAGPASTERLRPLLAALAAPPEALRAARAASPAAVRWGLGAAPGELRLYVHRRDPRTSKDGYEAVRWTPGGPARRATYAFSWLPESPEGQRPEDLAPPPLRALVAALASDERLVRSSGFWLRRDARGALDQLDLAWPWHPRAADVPGLSALVAACGGRLEPWAETRVRHTALRLAGPASVTLYASAPHDGPFPRSERALAEAIAARSAALAREADALHAALPAPPPPAGLAGFYDGPVDAWRPILGPGLHYHAGVFARPDEPPERAFRRAVTELYPHLPRRGRVYDVGCGWGGPLALIARDLGASVLGVTESRAQYRHVAARGLPVRWGDAAGLTPPGPFDCALLLESLSHFADKAGLLARLRPFAPRLVMRVNCQDAAPPSAAFGGTMHVISSASLRALVEGAGYRVTHWRDRRREGLPSVRVWQRRLRRHGTAGDRQLEVLAAWCDRVARDLEAWGERNPLIEVVAERA